MERSNETNRFKIRGSIARCWTCITVVIWIVMRRRAKLISGSRELGMCGWLGVHFDREGSESDDRRYEPKLLLIKLEAASQVQPVPSDPGMCIMSLVSLQQNVGWERSVAFSIAVTPLTAQCLSLTAIWSRQPVKVITTG
jgi:hypothetical protein